METYSKRYQSIKSIIRFEKTEEIDRKFLKKNLWYWNTAKYSSKLSVFAVLYFVYKKGYLNSPSKFFVKEIGIVALSVSYLILSEYFIQKTIWGSVQPTI